MEEMDKIVDHVFGTPNLSLILLIKGSIVFLLLVSSGSLFLWNKQVVPLVEFLQGYFSVSVFLDVRDKGDQNTHTSGHPQILPVWV